MDIPSTEHGNKQDMHWTIDRFEGDFAVLTHHQTLDTTDVEIAKLPPGAKPGDSVKYKDNLYYLDPQETALRKKRINERFQRIKTRNN